MYLVFVTWVYAVTFLSLLAYLGWILWRIKQHDQGGRP